MSEVSGGLPAAHARTALVLSVFTVAYNVGEGIVDPVAVRDDASALLGFGSDSFVESFSGSSWCGDSGDHTEPTSGNSGPLGW